MGALRPTTARLQRYSIDLKQIAAKYDLWLLDLPFEGALEQFAINVQDLLRGRQRGEYLGVPYRLLNNAFMTLCPTLTHGFEKLNGLRSALVVSVPHLPAQLPNPRDIRRIIRIWAKQWVEQPYITEHISAQVWQSLRKDLEDFIVATADNWQWRQVTVADLLKGGLNNPVNYHAVPSILASLLHNKKSVINDTEIFWRKVQDGDGKLSVVSQPLWATYTEIDHGEPVTKTGWFAYKLAFELETQTGKDENWVFVSVHAQRYGDTKLTRANSGRNVSVLVGANKSRRDEFPFDSTLVKLTFDYDKKRWEDDLPSLLNLIGVLPERQLISPDTLTSSDNPISYWMLDRQKNSQDEEFINEYYIVHTEGYGYGSHRAGHGIRPGYSQTERNAVLSAALDHLPLLQPDRFLSTDSIPFPSGRSKPRAMRNYGEMKELKTVQSSEMTEAIKRALRGATMYIAVIYNDQLTRDGIITALRKAFFLKDGEDFPPNVRVQPHFISDQFHEKIQGGRFAEERRIKVRAWSDYLQEMMPLDTDRHNFFAIVERVRGEHGWGIYGVIRDACAQNQISSQMIESLTYLNEKKERHSKRDSEHRADNAAREVVLRHIGGFYGDPKETYKAAGIDHPLEVLAFHLHRDQTGITYPVAVKIAVDGAVEACFPKSDPNDYSWELYPCAATSFGRLVAGQWKFLRWDGEAKRRKLAEFGGATSILAMHRTALTRFVMNVLLDLQVPTIAVISAKNWRNYNVWPQLRNVDLSAQRQVLNFNNVPGTRSEEIIQRKDPRLQNLLAMVRVRADDETPQYLTDTLWEFKQGTGLIDLPNNELLHYFSIGKELKNNKKQNEPKARYATMMDGAAGISYRMSQIMEFVPFFVRPDYDTVDSKMQICRVLHYLRVSPAWEMGNILYPYPAHLAAQMVQDQLSILGNDE